MSKTDAATVTSRALLRCLMALTVVFVASVVYSPPKHVAHWVVMGSYLAILVAGMVAATKRVRGLLRLYWIAQFVLLLLTLGAIICGIVFMVQEMKSQPQTITLITNSGDSTDSTTSSTTTTTTTTATTTIEATHSDTTVSDEDSNADNTHTTVDGDQTEIEHHQTMTAARNSPVFIVVNVIYLFVFLMILAIKVRSILLAQRLLKQMDELPYMEDNQFELESQQPLTTEGTEYNVEAQYTQPAVAPQPVYFIHPASLQPGMTNLPVVLVDQYGNVVGTTPQ